MNAALITLAVLAALGLVYAGNLARLGAVSRRPRERGLLDGRLRPCRRSTNCVCSQPGCGGREVEPLSFTGPPEAAMERLVSAVASLPGARIVRRDGGYLHAEVTSKVFGFVDDFEAQADPAAGELHVRSGSRVGIGDQGVNARRVAEVRRRFEAFS